MLFAILWTSPVFSEDNPPDKVVMTVRHARESMVNCPERIWTGFNWKDLNLVLVYPSKEQSWIWSVSIDKISVIDNRLLSPRTLGSSYDFFEWANLPSLSINVEHDDDIYGLAVHEFFHDQGQKNWKPVEKKTESRGLAYPLQANPRFYRRMLLENLYDYFSKENFVSLIKARFWHDLLIKEFPNETELATDRIEGSAEYVEMMAMAISEVGCSASEDTLKNEAMKHLDHRYRRLTDPQFTGFDYEGYVIGGLATLILRFSDLNMKAWTQAFVNGVTPIEQLLDKILPAKHLNYKEQNRAAKLSGFYAEVIDRMNREYGKLLDRDIRNWSNKDYVRVSFPFEWCQSTLRPKYFIHSTKLDKQIFPLAVDHHFVSPNKEGSSFVVKSKVVIIQNSDAFFPLSMLIHKDALPNIKDSNEIFNKRIKGKLQGRVEIDEEGYIYLFLE